MLALSAWPWRTCCCAPGHGARDCTVLPGTCLNLAPIKPAKRYPESKLYFSQNFKPDFWFPLNILVVLLQLTSGMWTANWEFLKLLLFAIFFLSEMKKYVDGRFCRSTVGYAFVSEVSLDFIFSQLLFLLILSVAIKVDHAVNWDELMQEVHFSHKCIVCAESIFGYEKLFRNGYFSVKCIF